MTTFSDETLMAYADGELPDQEAQHLRRALADDAELRARLDVFTLSASWLRRQTGPVLREPVPDRLLQALATAPAPSAAARPRAPWPRLALAASLVAGIGVGGLLVNGLGAPEAVPSLASLDERAGWNAGMDGAASGEVFTLDAGGSVRPLYTFLDVDQRFCRVFAIDGGDGTAQRGMACRAGDGRWPVQLLAAGGEAAGGGAAAGTYQPAGGAAASPFDSAVEAIAGSAPLAPGLERKLIEGGWQRTALP